MSNKSFSTDSLAIEKTDNFEGKKFRIAVIGCGGISQFHAAAMQEMPDVEIVAAVDIESHRLDHFQSKWNVSALYKDWKTMLKEVHPDGVSVCTPNGVHMEPTIDSLNAGAHVLVEKPMALSPDQCQAMIDTAKKKDKKLSVGFQYRYHPNTQFLKRAADQGQFGDIMFVRVQALRRRGIPNWGVFGQKELQGGGPMIDIGVHGIEMAHFVIGSPKPVAAVGNTWTYHGNKPSNVVSQWPNWDHKTYTVEDMAIGHIRFENGAILHIEASFVAHIEKDVWNFEVMGTEGGGRWDPPATFRDVAGTMLNGNPGFLPEGTVPSLFKIKIRNWVDAATTGTELASPGEAGLDVQKMLDGVYRSAAAGGKEVSIV